MVFCTEGSSERWRRAQTTSQPTAKPAATPPAAPTTNCNPASQTEKAPVTKGAGDNSGDRDAVSDYTRGVVDEALAFQDRNDAAGHAEALGDRGGGDGVGGGDDGPEYESRAPGQPDDGVGD